MLKEKSWFVLPKNNLPGNYIVKTPSVIYPNIPENEFSMMKLAESVGIDIPEVQLVTLDNIDGLPDESYAYAIKRFDRIDHGKRIQIEDFAQAFGVKPRDKYQATNYDSMAKFIYQCFLNARIELTEFIRRLVFNLLIGNTDAHLKNWSIIYGNTVSPQLSPRI